MWGLKILSPDPGRFVCQNSESTKNICDSYDVACAAVTVGRVAHAPQELGLRENRVGALCMYTLENKLVLIKA
jgi:hypothetical protein